MSNDNDFKFAIRIDPQQLMLRMCEAFVDKAVPLYMPTDQALAEFAKAMPNIAEGMMRATSAACDYITEQIGESLTEAGFVQEITIYDDDSSRMN